jgi:hypothetical protein
MILHDAFTNESIIINDIVSLENFNVSINKKHTKYVTKLVTSDNIYLVRETIDQINNKFYK